MAKLKRPLLIVIDDIDRLTSDEIREVFQLVKANADFPNIIYLLMFDRRIVAGALDAISGNRGGSFLEKIVQVAFQVPLPALSDVHTVLTKRLDACLAQEGVATRWDERRWIDVWFHGLRPYFMNLRSVYRFLSSLEFQISQMRNGKTFELNPMDLIALEAIRLFEPTLYEVLGASRSILVPEQVERLETMFLSDDDKRKRSQANQQRLLSYVPAERRQNVTVILKDLFPVLFEETPDESRMHRELRAGIGAFFDRYFTLSLHSDDVPQADMDALLETISKPNEFSRVCESLMRMGKLDKAFDRLDAYNCNLSRRL